MAILSLGEEDKEAPVAEQTALEKMQAGHVDFSTWGSGGICQALFFPPWKSIREVLLTGPRVPRPDCWSLWWGFWVGSAQPRGHCSPRPGLAEQRQTTFPRQSGAPRGPSSSVGKHRVEWAPGIARHRCALDTGCIWQWACPPALHWLSGKPRKWLLGSLDYCFGGCVMYNPQLQCHKYVSHRWSLLPEVPPAYQAPSNLAIKPVVRQNRLRGPVKISVQ